MTLDSLQTEKLASTDFLRYEPFRIRVKNRDGKEAVFKPASGPENSYASPPFHVERPLDILSVPRTTYQRNEYTTKMDVLERSWSYKTPRGLEIFGTPDHHQLYLHQLQKEKRLGSENDVLLNLDSHDDIGEPYPNEIFSLVSIGDFVRRGISPDLEKTWDSYILVAPPEAAGRNLKFLGEKAKRFGSSDVLAALEEGLKQAQAKHSKMVITIDFDFFGSPRIVDFDKEFTAKVLTDLFTFVKEHEEDIELVHFTESVEYAQPKTDQVVAINKMIVAILTHLGSTI